MKKRKLRREIERLQKELLLQTKETARERRRSWEAEGKLVQLYEMRDLEAEGKLVQLYEMRDLEAEVRRSEPMIVSTHNLDRARELLGEEECQVCGHASYWHPKHPLTRVSGYCRHETCSGCPGYLAPPRPVSAKQPTEVEPERPPEPRSKSDDALVECDHDDVPGPQRDIREGRQTDPARSG